VPPSRRRGSVPHALLERGWVDEIVLAVYPLLMGHGTRGFPDEPRPRGFEFVRSLAIPTGVLLNAHRRVGERATDGPRPRTTAHGPPA